MLKKLHFWLTALVLAFAVPAFAQRTVTLANYNFEDGDAIDNTVITYDYDSTANSTSYWNLQDVPSWTASTSKNGMAGAVFAYGDSIGLGSSSYYPPTTGPDGGEGKALGVVAVWSETAYYTSEEVTLAPGEYTVTIPVYNGSGTATITNLSGVNLADGTTYYASATTYTVGEWTVDTITFTLEDAATATVTLGYTSLGGGSSSNPHLFYDEVAISYEPVVVEVEEGDYYIQVDGEYKFWTRGGAWGTEAVKGEHGVVFTVISNEDGTYKLRTRDRYNATLDDYGYLSGPTGAYTDSYVDYAASWSFEEADADGTYYIVNSNSYYVNFTSYTYNDYSTYYYTSETSDLSSASTFTLLSEEEYATLIQQRIDESAAAAAAAAGLASVTTEEELEAVDLFTEEDCTESITDADCSAGSGWTLTGVGSNGGAWYNNGVLETWNCNGTARQTISGLDEGLYKLTAKAWSCPVLYCYTNTDSVSNVSYLFASTASSEAKKLITLHENDGTAALSPEISELAASTDSTFLNTLYIYVAEGEDLEIGYVQEGNCYCSWTIADDWTLTKLTPANVADITVTSIDPEESTEDDPYVTYTGLSSIQLQASETAYIGEESVIVKNASDEELSASLTKGRGAYVYVALDETITESGYYYVILPEGALVDYNLAYGGDSYGHINAADTLTYYVSVQEPEFYSDPASGDTISSLSTIEITCSTGYLDANYWASDDAVITDAEGDTIATISISDYSYNSDYTGVIYTLDEEIVKAGTYTLTFPAGVFAIDADSWSEYYDSVVVFTYIVDGSEEPAYWITADPEDGSTVKSLSTISITFDDYTSVLFSSTAYVYEASDYEENGTSATMVTYSNSSSYDGNTITIGLKADVTENGDYVVVIKSGKISLSTDGSTYTNTTEAIELYYTVKGVPTGMSVDPADESTIEELSTIVISFSDADTLIFTSYPYIFVYTDEDHSNLYYAEDATTSMGCTNSKGSYTVEGTTVTINFNYSATEAGDYYVRFPSGYFTVDGESIEEVILHYIIEDTSSDDGDDDDDDTTVTITGVTLASGGSYEGLSSGETVQFTIEPASSVGYAFYKIGTTEGGADLKSRSSLTYNSETGYWESEVYSDYTFESGETYYITVAAYATENDYNYGYDALAELSYTITGSGEASSLSSVTLTSLYPANESEIDTSEGDLSVLLAFSDKVNINSTTSFLNLGQGVTYAFSSITGDSSTTGEDGLEYSDYWTLVVSEAYYSIFTDGLTLTVVATDEEGNRVYDSALSQSEDADYTYFLISYYYASETEYLSTDALTITEEDGVVTVASTDGSALGLGSGTATLYDADGNVVAEKLDGESNFDWDNWTGGDAYTYDLSSYLTEDGTYTLVIPAGAITDSDGNGYDEITVTITIGEEEEEASVEDGNYYFKVSGEYQYLQRAGNWGTELTLGSVGTLFTLNNNEDGTFYLTTTDAVAAGSSNIYVTGPTSAYVDASSGAATWSLEDAGDDTYYIVNSNGNYLTGTYYEDTTYGYAYYYIGEATSDAPAFELLSKDEYLESLSARLDDQAAAAAEAAGLSATTVEELETAVANYYVGQETVDYDNFSAIYTNGATGIYAAAAISDPTIEVYNGCGGAEQTISGLTAGLYKVTVNAMSRAFLITSYYTTDDDGNTVATDLVDVSSDAAFIYANDAIDQTGFYTDYEGYLDVNSISDFTTAAEDGAYEKVLYVYVADGEDLTIGFQAPYRTNYEASWTITANWALYLITESEDEANATGISSISTEGTFEPTAIYSVSGQLVRTQATSFEGLNKGIYIVNGQKVLVK